MTSDSSDYLTAREEAAGRSVPQSSDPDTCTAGGAQTGGSVPHGSDDLPQFGGEFAAARTTDAAASCGLPPASCGMLRQSAAATAAEAGWREWGSAAAAGTLPPSLPQAAAAAGGLPQAAAAAGGLLQAAAAAGGTCQPGGGGESPLPLSTAGTAPESGWTVGSGSMPPSAAADAAGSGMPPAGYPPGGRVPTEAGWADYGSSRIHEPSLSVAEAARQVGIPERTLRAWIGEGRVPAFRPDPTRRGMRLPLSALAALRQRVAESGSMPHGFGGHLLQAAAPTAGGYPPVAGHPPEAGAAVEVLQAKLDGAQAAVRLHAQRRQEEREQHREERARFEEELAFLRERMVKAEEAERELRILLAQQTQASQQTAYALQALTEKPALPPPAEPPPARVRWWMPWKRGG